MPRAATIRRNQGSRNIGIAEELKVSALNGCQATKANVLRSINKNFFFLFCLFVFTGISMPLKKASSSKEGKIKTINGRAKEKLVNKGLNINKLVLKPIIAEITINTGTKDHDLAGTLSGETRKPWTRLFLRYSIISWLPDSFVNRRS